MFAPNSQNLNAKWQDKFVFHYGAGNGTTGGVVVDKHSTGGIEGVVLPNSVLLSPTTPTTAKCCIPSPFQVPSDNDFFGAHHKAATYPETVVTTTPSHHDDFFILDTPKSAFCPASVSTAAPQAELIFKFEPEHIELMAKCDQYIEANFNDDNCQGKNYSPCNTPPSMSAHHVQDEYNHFDFTQYQTPLPPINTIQSSVQYPGHAHHQYDEHFIDTSFLAQYPSPVPRVQAATTAEFQSDSYFQPANFNVTGDEKPNREFKHIDFDDVAKGEATSKSDLLNNEDALCEKVASEVESSSGGGEPVTCLWADCYKEFCSQPTLVAHIEKVHIEGRKGEEFSCFWRGCSRSKKPFNARYKLLIHMRVHSGEKPNKCPVRKLWLI